MLSLIFFTQLNFSIVESMDHILSFTDRFFSAPPVYLSVYRLAREQLIPPLRHLKRQAPGGKSGGAGAQW